MPLGLAHHLREVLPPDLVLCHHRAVSYLAPVVSHPVPEMLLRRAQPRQRVAPQAHHPRRDPLLLPAPLVPSHLDLAPTFPTPLLVLPYNQANKPT